MGIYSLALTLPGASPPPAVPVWITTGMVMFLLGVAVGFIFKHMLKFAIALFALVVILLAVGYIAPQVLAELIAAFKPEASGVANDVGLLAPYEGIVLLAGFILGVWKG